MNRNIPHNAIPFNFKIFLVFLFGIALLYTSIELLLMNYDKIIYDKLNAKSVEYLKNYSNIIKNYDEAKLVLNEFFDREIIQVTLIFSRIKDGKDFNNFHKKCDEIPNSLILIKSKDNSIRIGGFTSASWKPNYTFKYDENMFIFDINKKERYDFPDKNKVIFVSQNFGPCFGIEECISDIVVGKDSWYFLHSIKDKSKYFSRINFELENYEVYSLEFANK